MMGFRVLMYAGAGIGAFVYFWNWKEVRALTASAHEIEDEMLDEKPGEEEPGQRVRSRGFAELKKMAVIDLRTAQSSRGRPPPSGTSGIRAPCQTATTQIV